jgi:fibronectin-binding autotransporter adhesin
MKAKSLFAATLALAASQATLSAQTTFEWTGGVDGTGNLMFDPAGYGNWNPALAAADVGLSATNSFVISSRNGGGAAALIGNGSPLVVDINTGMRSLIFENTAGHLPNPLVLVAKADPGTLIRYINFPTPDTTVVSLHESVTGTIRWGTTISSTDSPNSRLGLRLPSSGVSTFHVANPNAVLDFTGAFDNFTGQGAIHGGSTTQSLAHAKLRKTGAGTIDLRTSDAQGNRVLGAVIEGGVVVIGVPIHLGWGPVDFMEDHWVMNGGTLRLQGLTTAPSATRGIQIGSAAGTFDVLETSTVLFGVISDVPAESGRLIKTGPTALRLAAVNTYTGGTLVQQGVLRFTTPGSFGTGTITLEDGTGLTAFAGSPLIANTIEVNGPTFTLGTGGDGQSNLFGGVIDLKGGSRALTIGGPVSLAGGITNGTLATLSATSNAATLALDADVTLSAPLTVNRGIVAANQTLTGDVVVTRGTGDPSFTGGLGGSGILNGSATVDGELRPGASHSGSVGTLNVSGNLTVSSQGLSVFEINAGGSDQVDVTGNLSLAGSVEVSLIDGHVPEIGESFQLVRADGTMTIDPAINLILPLLAGDRLWDSSDFVETGEVTVISGTVKQETYTWTNNFSDTTASLTSPSNFANWSPETTAADFQAGSANTFILGTAPGGSAVPAGYTFTLDASPRTAALRFHDEGGLFPAELFLNANTAGDSTPRTLWFELPDTTAIELDETFTGILRLGQDSLNSGPLGIRLPNSGVTTFHVANAAATLDLSGLLNAEPDRGAIHSGAVTRTTAHARIRKTGDGTLDLRTSDPEGNRVLGITIEGGRVIVNSATQLGWLPSPTMPDQVIINGGTLRSDGNTTSPGVTRGFMIGENGATFEIVGGSSFTINGVVQDLPGHSGGGITKRGTFLLTLPSANTYTGETYIEEGRISYATNSPFGTGLVRMGEDAGFGSSVTSIAIANNIRIEGTSARFGMGSFLNTLNGNIDLDGDQRTLRMINTLIINGVLSNGGIVVQTDLNSQRLDLNGENTYEDSTTVNRGRLVVNGSITSDVLVTRGVTADVAIGGLGGAGTITGNVVVSGEIHPGRGTGTTVGTLVIDGELLTDASAASFFEISGETTSDLISGLSSASMDGTVTVTLTGGYVPAVGAAFQLVECSTPITLGDALQFVLPALPSGRAWDTSTFATDGSIQVVSSGGVTQTPYQLWAQNYGLSGNNALPGADPDGDGFTNEREFTFGGHPGQPTASLMSIQRNGANVEITYIERNTGVTYQVQRSATLSPPWTQATGITFLTPVDQTGVLLPAEYTRKRFSTPAAGKDFFRVEATVQP